MNTKELWYRYKTLNDTEARTELILIHMPYAETIARQMYSSNNHGFTLDEITSSAYLGLIDAVDKYTGAKNASFRTYARTRIRGAIIDNFRHEGMIPMSLVRWHNRMESSSEPLEELARKYRIKASTLSRIKDAVEAFRIEFVGEDYACLDEAAEDVEDNILIHILLEDAMQELSRKERYIIYSYYYLSLSQSDIAKRFNCTEANISNIRNRTLEKLRRILNE